MKLYKSIFLIIIALIIIVFLTLKVYFSSESPAHSGKKEIKGITDKVEIFTDKYGTPNIYAHNDRDLFFSAGYITAQERLFQLSLIHSIINGRIADLLGDDYLSHDQFIRSRRAPLNSDLTAISDSNLVLIQAYCEGINYYINDKSNKLPVSFKFTGASPQEWTVTDAIASVKLMTNNNLADASSATIQAAIKKYFGESRSFNIDVSLNPENALLGADDLMLEYEIMDLIGANITATGSAAKIIKAQNTKDRKPILVFNDAQGYRSPSKWFDVGLNSPGYSVHGSSVIGFPLPLVGGSETFAFAFNDKITNQKLNLLFDLLRTNSTKDRQSLNDQSIVWADTAGNFSSNNYQDIHLAGVGDLSELDVPQLSTILHESKNVKKAELLNLVLSNDINLEEAPELSAIKDWDGCESDTSRLALLANTIIRNLTASIFKDELTLIGENIYQLFIHNTNLVETVLENEIRNSESAWLDDINTTNHVEDLNDNVRKAINTAMLELKSKFGELSYPWGKANPSRFKHVLGNGKMPRLFADFNSTELSLNGTDFGKSIQELLYDEDLAPASAVVLIKIFDLSEPSACYSRLLPGQSGIPSSVHYADQMELYKRGALRRLDLDETIIKSDESYQHLILYPSE